MQVALQPLRGAALRPRPAHQFVYGAAVFRSEVSNQCGVAGTPCLHNRTQPRLCRNGVDGDHGAELADDCCGVGFSGSRSRTDGHKRGLLVEQPTEHDGHALDGNGERARDRALVGALRVFAPAKFALVHGGDAIGPLAPRLYHQCAAGLLVLPLLACRPCQSGQLRPLAHAPTAPRSAMARSRSSRLIVRRSEL